MDISRNIKNKNFPFSKLVSKKEESNKRYPIPESERSKWEKLTGKNKNFRIDVKANPKQKLKFKLEKFKKGMEVKEGNEKTNVIHITQSGDIYLIPAFHSSKTLYYKADKPYQKVLNYSKRIGIHYFDGKIEEGYLCDNFSPANFKVNPSLEKTAVHSQVEFENAYNTFEKDLIRATAFNYTDKQVKMFIMFLLAGIGLASLIWLGGFFILTI